MSLCSRQEGRIQTMVIDYLEQYFDEIEPLDFYRTIFPKGSFEDKGCQDNEEHKYNGIVNHIVTNSETNQTRCVRYVVTDELDVIKDIQDQSKNNIWTIGKNDEIQLSLMNGISYIGDRRLSKNAREMYAMIIEIDDLLGESPREITDELDKFGHQIEKDVSKHNGIKALFHLIDNGFLPRPTFIVASGSGVHLYYVFEKPILLFPDTIKSLQQYRKILVEHLWIDSITSSWNNIQYESLFQSFRMVGSPTKKRGTVRAFWCGEKTTIEEMSDFYIFDTWKKADIKTKHLTLEQAKKKYPEWYQRRIVNKEPKGTWTNKIDLYNWWIRQVKEKYQVGGRYYSLMCLSAYAIKCDVPQDKLEEDMWELFSFMKSKEDEETREENPLTEHDIYSAMQVYLDNDLDPHNFTIDFISDRTGIKIERNKRNGRKQAKHLEGARALQRVNEDYEGQWREGNGRKPKEDIVKQWRKEHPDGKKAQCIKDTGLSKPTVYKWW